MLSLLFVTIMNAHAVEPGAITQYCLTLMSRLGAGPEIGKISTNIQSDDHTAIIQGTGASGRIYSMSSRGLPDGVEVLTPDGKKVTYVEGKGCRVESSGYSNAFAVLDEKYFKKEQAYVLKRLRELQQDTPGDRNLMQMKYYCTSAIEKGEIGPDTQLYKILTRAGAVTVNGPAAAPEATAAPKANKG